MKSPSVKFQTKARNNRILPGLAAPMSLKNDRKERNALTKRAPALYYFWEHLAERGNIVAIQQSLKSVRRFSPVTFVRYMLAQSLPSIEYHICLQTFQNRNPKGRHQLAFQSSLLLKVH